MGLWILRPVEHSAPLQEGRAVFEHGPWDPWYDKAFGFVVRADTEQEARAYADKNAGDENVRSYRIDADRMELGRTNPRRIPESWDHPWLHADLSTCVPLTDEGKHGIVMVDFASA